MVEIVTVEMALAAVAGGVFGAAMGGRPAFTFAGFVIFGGAPARHARGSLAGAVEASDPAALGAVGITGSLGLGPLLGPHVAFAGGVAAAAYAADRESLEEDFEYHGAKNIVRGLGSKPDVLLVGGAFGVFGVLVARVSAVVLGLPMDPIALAIVVSAFVHRAVFGYRLVGDVRGNLLDMSPYFQDERRTDGGRPAVEPWLPHQSPWLNNVVLGFAMGLFGAFVAYATASPFLAFGISIATFAFVVAGIEGVPITLHMTLPASIAALALLPGDVGLAEMTPALVQSELVAWQALLVGGVFGATSGLTGELAQRTLYAHAETHLDPPATAIALNTLAIGLLVMTDVFTNPVVLPMP
jgi:hypothetical protein